MRIGAENFAQDHGDRQRRAGAGSPPALRAGF